MVEELKDVEAKIADEGATCTPRQLECRQLAAAGLTSTEIGRQLGLSARTVECYPHGIVRLESQFQAITTDPAFKAGDYAAQPAAGLSAFGMVWAPWLYSQEWWRRELWKVRAPNDTLAQAIEKFRHGFIAGADANDLILQMRTWEHHDVGTTPGFGGDTERALRSIQAPVLYMPSATDLYFPLEDAKYEATFIPKVELRPIPSLWGHTAGATSNPADGRFLNDAIGRFITP